MLRTAARGHVETVRTSLFDALNTEQQAALREISETLVGHLLASPLQPATESRSSRPNEAISSEGDRAAASCPIGRHLDLVHQVQCALPAGAGGADGDRRSEERTCGK